jgi:hypothetical protein
MKELDVFGVYLSPFVADLVLGAIAFAPVKLALDGIGADRFVWHRQLFDICLFVSVVSAVSLSGVARSLWPL